MSKRLLMLLALFAILLEGCSQVESFFGGVIPAEPTPTATLPVPTPVQVAQTPTLAPEPEAVQVDYCLECHSNQQMLMDTASPDAMQPSAPHGLLWAGDLPELKAWEKVLVDGENFIPTVHGRFPCTSCHGGVQTSDKDSAHQDLNLNPSQGPEVVCGECHPDIEADFKDSLHSSLRGFLTTLAARSTSAKLAGLEAMFEQACSSCHNTCGDCHVSMPKSVGGGLLDGHLFQRNPPMQLSCISCHGSTNAAEFMGSHTGIPADVHYTQAGFSCTNCHAGSELHGLPSDCKSCHPGPESDQMPLPNHRFASNQTPSCESCHVTVSTGQDDILMHQMHGANLSCQVCHSVAYNHCEGCHVTAGEQAGEVEVGLQASKIQFLIGRNPIQTFERPYRYVPVRHAPISRDSFAFFGEDLLPNYDALETWKYATPHNIQRRTPQTEFCNSCHGNPEIFLTPDKVSPDELAANRNVVVERIPAKITSADQLP